MAKKPTAIRLDENLLKQLKIITIENGTSIQKIVEAFLIEYVNNHQNDTSSTSSNEKDYFDDPFPTTWKQNNDDNEYHECSNDDWDDFKM